MNPVHDYTILAVAAAFGLMGIGALLNPTLVTAQFGITELTAAGRNEVRAVYGGFGILMACALVSGLYEPVLRPGIVYAVALALAGMAAGRLYSAVMDRRIDRWPAFYFVIEGVCAVLLIVTLR